MTAFHVASSDGAMAFDCNADESLVRAAERAGWDLPASCRSGVCGSCEGEVLAGRYVTPGRNDDGPLHAGPATRVKLCQVRPRSDLRIAPREVRRLDAASRKLITAKVLRVDKPAPEVAVLKLRFPAGTRAKFRAGQYLKIQLDDGAERSFSMANAPQHNDGVELHVRQLPGGRFSDQVFDRLKPGDAVTLRMPLGDFHLREASERPLVFVAGGTGFAPVQSMIEDLLRTNTERRVHLYVGARRPELLYGDAPARRWLARRPDWRYVPVVSDPAPGDGWDGRRGFVHQAVVDDLPDLSGCEVYACGSPPMVAAAREAFEAHGLPPARFFCDAFAPAAEASG